MSTVIRLARHGCKKKPYYRVVVADSRNRRDGRFIEHIGSYNPVHKTESEQVTIKRDRLDYWLSVGAQMSPSVASQIKRAKTVEELAQTEEVVIAAEKTPKDKTEKKA